MKTWLRAHRDTPCGNCSGTVKAGDPLLEVGDAKLVRCPYCAKRMFGEDPPELPELEVPVQTGFRPLGFVSTKAISRSGRWRDVKQRQTGEPG